MLFDGVLIVVCCLLFDIRCVMFVVCCADCSLFGCLMRVGDLLSVVWYLLVIA